MKQVIDFITSDPWVFVPVATGMAIILLFVISFFTQIKDTTKTTPAPVEPAEFADDVIAILDALKYSGKWKCGEHTVDHSSGLRLWTSNGEKHCKVYEPTKYEFGRYDERAAVWKAIEKMRRRKIVSLLENQ